MNVRVEEMFRKWNQPNLVTGCGGTQDDCSQVSEFGVPLINREHPCGTGVGRGPCVGLAALSQLYF